MRRQAQDRFLNCPTLACGFSSSMRSCTTILSSTCTSTLQPLPHVDELIFRQMELRHHRLSIRIAKAQPFLLWLCSCCRTTQSCRHGERDETHCAGDFHAP